MSHIYELNGNATDTLGGPALTTNGGTFTSTAYTFTANKGLIGTNVVDKTEYSIELRYNYLATASTGYKKLIDFANQTADAGLYEYGTDLRFFPASAEGATKVPLGTVENVVLTRDGTTKVVTGYVNGVKQWSVVDTALVGVFSGTGNVMKLFMDDGNGGENGPGSVDRVRIYKGVLTDAQVAALNANGVPPGLAPEVDVRGNAVVIADGKTTPAATDFTDFGTTGFNTPVSKTFAVYNLGGSALTTSALTVPAGFTVTEGLSASIAPGASDTFTVRSNATVAGTFSGDVTFKNNDANENPYNFSIKSIVTPTTFSLVSGVLTVTGTTGNDYIRGSIANNVLTMKVNALSQTFNSASTISRIVVNALAGNDLILLATSVNRPTSLNGGDGDDTIYGGAGADVINGGVGTDSAVKGVGDALTLVEEILA